MSGESAGDYKKIALGFTNALEAVTVVVTLEEDALRVRTVDFGRP